MLMVLLMLAGLAIALVAFTVLRRGGASPSATPTDDAPFAGAVPDGFFWAKMRTPDGRVHALGYCYRDAAAGPSFRALVELSPPKSDAQIRDAARDAHYRGDTIHRLGAHETLQIPSTLPPDFAALLRKKFESPQRTVLLRLQPEEIATLALPSAPGWISHYVR